MLGLVSRAALGDAERRIEALEAEKRNYTQLITDALIEGAADSAADGYTGALEIAASQLSRAFTAATVDGPDGPLLTPWAMGQIGRSLVETGESVWLRSGRRLIRAETYGIQPNGRYEIQSAGSVMAGSASDVLHVRWNVDVASQRGVGPLANARTLRTLLQRLETSMANEGNTEVGYLLPVPDADRIEQLRSDLNSLKGRVAVVETSQGGWGDGPQGAPRRDFELARIGPNVPQGNVNLFEASRNTVLAACGYPVQLVMGTDGTGQREAWRRYLHGTVAPLGRLVVTAAEAIGLNIGISFDQLFASDIQGRARAFQSLVASGLSLDQAAAASGILQEED